MEDIMALRDLITWGRDQPSVPSRRGEEVSPFLTLHREMNRLFDNVFNSFSTPSLVGRMPVRPSVEVAPSDKDVRISAELPGLDEKDVEVLVDDNALTSMSRKHLPDRARPRGRRDDGAGHSCIWEMDGGQIKQGIDLTGISPGAGWNIANDRSPV